MNAQISYNETLPTIEPLQASLIQFGLNPTDWTLKQAGIDEFLILSQLDRDFIFVGKATNSSANAKWKFIHLLSI